MQFASPTLFGGSHVLAWGMPMGAEWIVVGLVSLLIFGKRLPGLARSFGSGIVEFKRGLNSAEHEASEEQTIAPADAAGKPQPRFDPQTGKPLADSESGRVA